MTTVPPDKMGFLRVQSEHTPSPNDPVWAGEFYKALGILTVAWGRLEGHFVLCLINVLAFAKDERLGYSIPHTWEQRAKKWRDAFTLVDALHPIQPAAVALLDEILEASQDRNLVSHALWEGFNQSVPISMNTLSIKSKKPDELQIARVEVNVLSLRKATEAASTLNVKLLEISGFLSRVRGPPPSDAHRL